MAGMQTPAPGIPYPSSTQVQQVSNPTSAQLTFRQMTSEVLQWNPDVPAWLAQRWIQNLYRKILDSRNWYGMQTRGVCNVAPVYTTGSVAVQNGSALVTGTGTSWDTTMQGRSFRVGFTNPQILIQKVIDPFHLVLELPWGGQSNANYSYQIFQNIVSLGANVKRIYQMANQSQGFLLRTDIPQPAINEHDVWRTWVGYTQIAASFTSSSTGEPLWELYPCPLYQQSFPFIAITQPPDLKLDSDTPVTMLRSDILVTGALSNAFLYGGPKSKYFSPDTAQVKKQEFMADMGMMERNDNNLWQQDLTWDYRDWPFATFDASWKQVHDS